MARKRLRDAPSWLAPGAGGGTAPPRWGATSHVPGNGLEAQGRIWREFPAATAVAASTV